MGNYIIIGDTGLYKHSELLNFFVKKLITFSFLYCLRRCFVKYIYIVPMEI